EIVERLINGRERTVLRFDRGEVDLRRRRAGRVDSDDRVLRRDLAVRHLDAAVAPQDGLELVHRRSPREVLNVPRRLGYVPGDYDAVRQLLHVPRTGHTRLEEDADRWDGVGQRARG